MPDLLKVSTKDLVHELEKRAGVEKIPAEPYQPYHVGCTTQGISGTGPAVILVVTD